MNAVIQFDLFEAIPTKEEMMQLEIEYRLEVIERNICHG